MKNSMVALVSAVFMVSGCETMTDPISISRTTDAEFNGVYFYSDLMQEAVLGIAEGGRYRQHYARNNNSWPVCVRTGIDSIRYSNGYSMGANIYLSPNETKPTGYVYSPSDYVIITETWGPNSNGEC